MNKNLTHQRQAYNKSTVLKICIESVGKEATEQKVVMNTKPNKDHAALATQVHTQSKKKT